MAPKTPIGNTTHQHSKATWRTDQPVEVTRKETEGGFRYTAYYADNTAAVLRTGGRKYDYVCITPGFITNNNTKPVNGVYSHAAFSRFSLTGKFNDKYTPSSVSRVVHHIKETTSDTIEMKNKKTAAKTKKIDPAKPEKAKGKAKVKKEPRIDTGYVAAIRALLLEQKHTIAQAAAEIKEQYPEKEIDSIKRIAANVAKRVRRSNPDDKKLKDIRWLPGAATNTGYMARIDELLRAQKLTTRQVGEQVAKEFEKDPVSAKKVTRARLRRLNLAIVNKKDKITPPLESALKAAAEKATPAKSKKAATAKPAAKKAAKKSTKKVAAKVE